MLAQPTRRFRTIAVAVSMAALALLQGCSIYKLAGDQIIQFSKGEMVPYLLTYDDTQMSCSAGEALTPLLMTFEAVGSNPNQMAIIVFTASGMCAETEALEQELRYLRAVKLQQVSEAQDARIAQKRWHELAARRQYAAHQRFLLYYGEMPAGQCSKNLDSDFDQLMYMVGLVAGLQSVLNDTQSGQAVGVPRDIAAKVEHMATCIDSDKWWGLPEGVRAALWNLLPTLAPENAKPMDVLARIARGGEYRGVRIGHAIWALSAWGNGDKELTKHIIRDFAATGRTMQVDPKYRMLDTMATKMIMAISDRLWTEATGTRTPMAGLGTFWDDKSKSVGNIDDLL
jgi:hypothetical protein